MRSKESNLLVELLAWGGSKLFSAAKNVTFSLGSWFMPGGIIYNFHNLNLDKLADEVRDEHRNYNSVKGLEAKMRELDACRWTKSVSAELFRNFGFPLFCAGSSVVYKAIYHAATGEHKNLDDNLLREIMPLFIGYVFGTLSAVFARRNFVSATKDELKDIIEDNCHLYKGYSNDEDANETVYSELEQAFDAKDNDDSGEIDFWQIGTEEYSEELPKKPAQNRISKYFNYLPNKFDWDSFEKEFNDYLKE